MSNEVIESPFEAQRTSKALATETAGSRQNQSRELAEMQTKYLMAQQFKRNEVDATDRIINAFTRPSLAERSQYEYSRGGADIAGPSIHALQAIAQQWGNLEMGWRELSRGIGPDGVPYSEVESFAVDLQSRVPSRISFIVRHWRDTKSGGYRLKDERDIYETCANMAQRRKRACLESVLPKDIIDTAMEVAGTTLKARADTTPEAMAKMVAAFAEFGVTKEQIETRIQRRLDAISPSQVVQLKRIYASLRDEMSEPSEWFKAAEPAEGQPAPKSAADKAKETMKARAASKPAAKADPETGELIPRPTYAQLAEAINKAAKEGNADDAAAALDAGKHLPKEFFDELTAVYIRAFGG